MDAVWSRKYAGGYEYIHSFGNGRLRSGRDVGELP